MPSKSRNKWKKIWHFIWKEDSPLSWIINIILAFVIVKFLIFPGLGFILNTSHPVVAVVSSSMEHNGNFDDWWGSYGNWYKENGFKKEDVKNWIFSNGFNKGDIIILKGANIENIKNGDVIVFKKGSRAPIIHRVVKIYTENNTKYITTKGDNGATNPAPRSDETKISNDEIIGKAAFRIPFLGWIKIIFVSLFK